MQQQPTAAELGILQVLWELGPTTVRAVNDRLNEQSDKPIGYTTTLKIMQLMLDKGLLLRDESTRTHVYQPVEAIKSGLVSSLVQKAFQGSATQMVLAALGQHQASSEELAQIKALIAQKEQEQKNGNL